MTEELPLTPEVRAIQADALRPLDFQWSCDCGKPAAFGARRSCCKTAVVLCLDHCRQQINDIAGARTAGYGMVCPGCKCVFHPPVRPAHLFEYDINLMPKPDGG